MLTARFRQYLRWQRVLTLVAGLSLGLLSSVFSDWIANQGVRWLPWIAGVALLSSLGSALFLLRKPPGIEVAIESPLTIRSATEAAQVARRGFIGFVPLYRPQPGAAAAALDPTARAAAVEALDFEQLQLEASNLQPTITAIMSHATRLEHCWLLATSGQTAPGSLAYARLLAVYLRQQKGLRCKIHYGQAFTISLDDDALVLSKTYRQVQRIIAQTTRLGLSPREIVADITTGVRSMTLGMVLACLDGDQDVEFVGTHYNAQGEPEGDLFPIIFSFQPNLE